MGDGPRAAIAPEAVTLTERSSGPESTTTPERSPFTSRRCWTHSKTGFSVGLTQPLPITFSLGWPLREGDGDETEVFSFRLTLR